MNNLIKRLFVRNTTIHATYKELCDLRRQIGCLAELQSYLQVPIPYGKLGGWAISADALAVIARDIRARREPKVIEFGSGVSTIAIASLLRTLGGGALVSVEHDAVFQKTVQDELRTYECFDLVESHLCKIVECLTVPELGNIRSYDLSSLNIEFDVAIVDGPIVPEFGTLTRLVPLQWCAAKMKPGASIYLDDADRDSERHTIDRLLLDYPNMQVERLEAEKGLVRLTLQST